MSSDQVTEPSEQDLAKLNAALAENRGWFIALAVLLIIVGLAGIALPLMTTIAVKIFVGWLLLVSGIGQIIHAFSVKSWGGFFWNLLVGALYVLAGVWLAFFPLAGIVTLTVFLALTLIIEGGMKFALGFRVRPQAGWVWVIISGAMAAVLGLMLLAGLPGTAAWAIGLMVGINLLMSGVSFLMLV
ncbi:MAG: HdeD family acid-resistance protein, partial [Anderseniella sp.]